MNFWRDRSVFVTGATGLLGSWLVSQLLDADSRVVCLVRDLVPKSERVRNRRIEQVNTVSGDITDLDLLERVLGEYEVDVVLHVAAQAIVGTANLEPVSTFSTNIQGTWNLLEACRRSTKVSSIVVASSDKAYGDQQHLPYTEAMPLLGRHPYDVSKACGDMIAQAYAASYNMPVAVTRCGNFYGGGDLNWNRVVPARFAPSFVESDRSYAPTAISSATISISKMLPPLSCCSPSASLGIPHFTAKLLTSPMKFSSACSTWLN